VRIRRRAAATSTRPPVPTASRQVTLLLGIALLALVVRLVYVWQIWHAPFFDLRLGDADAYHRWALRIAGGDWLGEGVFYQAPLYPYFLGVLYKVFGSGAATIRVVQAAIGAGSCALVGAAGIALFGEWGALGGVLLAVYPSAIFQDGLLEKSTLAGFFTAALLLVLSARGARYRHVLAGIVLGLLALTRENALLLAVPILAWFLIDTRPTGTDEPPTRTRRSLRAAAFVGGCALILLPVAVRNYAVGGEFNLTTSQFGPNFYIGNHEGAPGLYDPLVSGHGSAADEQIDATRLAEEASGRALSPNEVSSYWTGRALQFIRSHPGAWLGQLARKLALTYNASESADTESQEVYAEWSPLLRALAPFSFGVLFCLAAFGFGITARSWRRLWFLYAIALTYTLSMVMFYVFARYRLPLVPLLTLFAAGGLAAWRDPSARRRVALAAVVVAAGLAYLPLTDTRMDRMIHYVNVANQFLTDPQRWGDAQTFYDKALRESPDSPPAHLGVGMLMAQMNKPAEAAAHYRIALDGMPDNADIHLNLAVALAETGDIDGALGELEAAASRRHDGATAHLIAAKLLLMRSRPRDAWMIYERALVVEPQNVDALMGSGLALTLLKRPDDAMQKYRRALEVDPRNADAHHALGLALATSGRESEAIPEFEETLAINPDDQDARSNLAQAQSALRNQRTTGR
jgi:tetratricopeptide (TPR) repeat protein